MRPIASKKLFTSDRTANDRTVHVDFKKSFDCDFFDDKDLN